MSRKHECFVTVGISEGEAVSEEVLSTLLARLKSEWALRETIEIDVDYAYAWTFESNIYSGESSDDFQKKILADLVSSLGSGDVETSARVWVDVCL